LLEGVPEKVRIVGKTADKDLELEAKPSKVDFSLGPLWARSRVSALEDRITLRPSEEEALRPEIIRIALEHKIASRFTAFVAVERSKKITGERVEIVQPVELPRDWDKAFLGMPGADQVKGFALASPSQYTMAAAPSMRDMSVVSAPEVLKRAKRRLRKSKEKEKRTLPSKTEEPSVDGRLARMQNADGSYSNDVRRTMAALIALIILGHTRRKGIRRRTVLKAAKWLESHSEDPSVSMALEILKRVEVGEDLKGLLELKAAEMQKLFSVGEEGKILKNVWNRSVRK
jgi:hypothetical protein